MDGTGMNDVRSEFSERRSGNRLTFDPSRAAILVVDMLNEFLEPGGEMVLLSGRRIIEPLNRLLAEGRRHGMRIVWLCDEHPLPDDREFDKRVPHCRPGTWGAEIIDELKPDKGDLAIEKLRYSAFSGTNLDMLLKNYDIKYLIFSGVATNICVETSIRDAYHLEYFPILVTDA